MAGDVRAEVWDRCLEYPEAGWVGWCKMKITSDLDRVSKSAPSADGQRTLGPVELHRCHHHPKRWESYRWSWPTPDDGDHLSALQAEGEVECLRICSVCDPGGAR